MNPWHHTKIFYQSLFDGLLNQVMHPFFAIEIPLLIVFYIDGQEFVANMGCVLLYFIQ